MTVKFKCSERGGDIDPILRSKFTLSLILVNGASRESYSTSRTVSEILITSWKGFPLLKGEEEFVNRRGPSLLDIFKVGTEGKSPNGHGHIRVTLNDSQYRNQNIRESLTPRRL